MFNVISFSSPANVLGVGQNVIAILKQQRQSYQQQIGPIILNCVSGSERSGIATLAIATILATNSRRPILLSKYKKKKNSSYNIVKLV